MTPKPTKKPASAVYKPAAKKPKTKAKRVKKNGLDLLKDAARAAQPKPPFAVGQHWRRTDGVTVEITSVSNGFVAYRAGNLTGAYFSYDFAKEKLTYLIEDAPKGGVFVNGEYVGECALGKDLKSHLEIKAEDEGDKYHFGNYDKVCESLKKENSPYIWALDQVTRQRVQRIEWAAIALLVMFSLQLAGWVM